jgi:hypothetical protein
MTLYNRGYGSSRRYGRGGYGMGGVSLVNDDLKFGVAMCAAEMNDLLTFFSLSCSFLSFLSMVATAWMDMV